MASSSGSHAAPKTRALVASNFGDLPLDPLYEILLRLPAKLLCRLRTVCRSWRSMLSDPHFAAAHATRHPGPLIIATVDEGEGSDVLVNIMDLSGQILKQVRGVPGQRVVTTALDLVCLKKIDSSRSSYQFRSYFGSVIFLPDQLLNTATGAVYQIPDSFAKEHVDIASNIVWEPEYLLGQVTSTGEYKVLQRLVHYPLEPQFPGAELLEICTINGSSHTGWRAVAPLANNWLGVVIDGIVYSIYYEWHNSIAIDDQVIDEKVISTFDLETEKWGPFIRGPAQVFKDLLTVKQQTLANLNGSLAVVHGPAPNIDFWILMDSVKGLWVKKYVIQFEENAIHKHVNPLVVLGDGRVVLHKEGLQFLQIYDPRTNTLTDSVEVCHFSAVALFRGNLLSL